MISENTKKNIYLIAILAFVYVILFEFILPVNKVLPKPTIVWESLIHLWEYYSFGIVLFSTIGLVYAAILIGFAIIWLFKVPIIKLLVICKKSFRLPRIGYYIPSLFVIILFSFWFESSFIAQFVFMILFFISSSIRIILELLKEVREEYIHVAMNLKPAKIYSHVYWNSILPGFFCELKQLHVQIWLTALIYEFVSNTYGIGKLFKENLLYSDFGAFISIAIILSFVFAIGNGLIGYFKSKFANWEN